MTTKSSAVSRSDSDVSSRQGGGQGARRDEGGWRTALARLAQGQGLAVILGLLILYYALASPYFFTTDNLLLIGSTASALGIMAVFQTYLIVSGGVDLSVGATLALTGVAIGLMVEQGMNVWVAALLSLLIGLMVGLVNGFLAVKMKINSLIVSLGTLSFVSGLAVWLSNSRTLIVADKGFDFVGSGRIFGVPFPLILFATLAAAAFYVERRTVVGRAIYAIGGNPQAARLSGIKVDRTQITLYTLSGLSAGIAGVMVCSQLNAGSPQVGANFLLSVVTAVILGGTSLAGGIGSVRGTVIAVFVLQVMQNGFALLGYSSSVQTMALGVVLIVAVLLDQVTRRVRGLK